MRKVFVARQPILGPGQRVYGYELLFRAGPRNVYFHPDGDAASQLVVDHSLHVFGLDNLTMGQPVFINFTRPLLLDQTALLLPSGRLVVEILENVEPDVEVLQACRDLRRRGYLIALDDFIAVDGAEPLLDVADILKIDFLQTDPARRRALIDRLRPWSLKLLAEKVESREEFVEARSLGCELFQGFFFCKPEIVSREDIPANKLAYLRFLREINRPDMELARLEDLLKQDVALPVKLLRYVNSAWFGLSGRVESLGHALALLGARGLRQWASLVVVADLGRDRSPALVTTCLFRANFCERLALAAGANGNASASFLTGLFSALDALVGRPLEETLADVAVPDEVRRALLEGRGYAWDVLHLALAYEKGDWLDVVTLSAKLGIDEDVLRDAYVRAIQRSDEVVTPSHSG